MANPWENISLSDYEKHMSFETVGQLQALAAMMKTQLEKYPVSSVMILGAAGGNGFEHISTEKYKKVYAVDINRDYLEQCKSRYKNLESILECICADLTDTSASFPHADMLIANLLIEYTGYECFKKAVQKIAPSCLSCIIQSDTDSGFVSASPYIRVFDGLDEIHLQISEEKLTESMTSIGYKLTEKTMRSLISGKKLIMLDYVPYTKI